MHSRLVLVLVLVSLSASQTAWAGEDEIHEFDRRTHSFTTPTKGHADIPPEKAWDHRLPFYGEKLTELGFHLPEPVGVTIIGTYLKQDLDLQNLRISGDGINYNPVPFVAFDGASSSNYAIEAKLDAWILPFLNVFGIVGVVEGNSQIPVQINVGGLLDASGSRICKVPRPPEICSQTANIQVNPKYHGYNYGIGTVLAGGYKSFFVAVPLTVVKSDMNIVATEITTYTGELLLGNSFKLKHGMTAEIFIGASYLNVKYEASGFEPLSQINPILPDVYYELDAENSDKWTYILGGQYALSDKWQLQFQWGFGGSRTQYTMGGTYRF
jgi:hypothetical protein